jgi:hypothetical protein
LRPPPVWRRPLWWALLGLVLLLHLLLRERLAEVLASVDPQRPGLQRMEAVYTRQITPTAPPPAAPVVAATPPPAPAARAVAAVPAASAASDAATDESASSADAAVAQADAASAPVQPASAPAELASAAPAASAAPPALAVASSAAAASAPVAAASAAADPNGTELLYGVRWPASTRLRYQLDGWYRGAVQGNAQVEWLRQGTHYQVHLDVAIPPLFSRRMSSDGRIGPQGLMPQRYEQETRQLIGRPRRADIVFEPESIRLAEGQRVAAPAEVQDTASQFVQLIYLFTTRPALREPGAVVEFPLALPGRVDRWAYDIGPTERLDTPAGPIEAFHVRPRRPAAPGALAVQMWMAPRLQLMPVRIRIEQDAETWMDLRLAELPQQAGP